MGDPGLFGPDSVTWRVHSDVVMGVAGLRALLLQALHPVAMTGVAQHSDFRSDPWGRLWRTVQYVSVTSFGSTAEANRAGLRVRSVHEPLGGRAASGRRYRVDDPDLLCWVHCCLVDSFLSTFARAGGALTVGEADAYVLEQVRTARLVGLRPTQVPRSATALRDYFAEIRSDLSASADARDAARFVLLPPMPRLWMEPLRPAYTGVTMLAFALLPRWARRLYRLPGLPVTDVAATLGIRALRTALVAIPPGVRESPAVRAARERIAS